MERLTKLILPSLFFVGASIILPFVNLSEFINILGILSGLIQIAMFVYWIFEDSKEDKILELALENKEDSKEKNKLLNEIKDYQDNRESKLLKRQEIFATLIRGGAIPNKEIDKMIKSVRKNGIFLVSTLGGKEFKLKSVLNSMGKQNPISLVPSVLVGLGFKPVYFNDSLFIILKEDLPERLRKPEIIKKIIYNELSSKWREIQSHIIGNNIKVHQKWINGDGFNCSICIVDIVEGNLGVLYKRLQDSQNYRDNFSGDFKSLLIGHSSRRNIGEIISDKTKAKSILDKMAIGFLFVNLPNKIKEPLIKNEINITNKLEIKKFTDISDIDKTNLIKVISIFLPKEILPEEINRTAQKIIEEIHEYMLVVKELNLF